MAKGTPKKKGKASRGKGAARKSTKKTTKKKKR